MPRPVDQDIDSREAEAQWGSTCGAPIEWYSISSEYFYVSVGSCALSAFVAAVLFLVLIRVAASVPGKHARTIRWCVLLTGITIAIGIAGAATLIFNGSHTAAV